MRAQKDEGEEEALLTETTVFSAQRPSIGKMDRSRKMPKTVAPAAAHYQHALWPITTALAVLLLVSRDQQVGFGIGIIPFAHFNFFFLGAFAKYFFLFELIMGAEAVKDKKKGTS